MLQSLPQFALVSKFRISPFSHSVINSKGRQQTSQSVVNRCRERLVSIVISLSWPQNGQGTFSDVSMPQCTGKRENFPKVLPKKLREWELLKRRQGDGFVAYCKLLPSSGCKTKD
jgi:hypothetical protein